MLVVLLALALSTPPTKATPEATARAWLEAAVHDDQPALAKLSNSPLHLSGFSQIAEGGVEQPCDALACIGRGIVLSHVWDIVELRRREKKPEGSWSTRARGKNTEVKLVVNNGDVFTFTWLLAPSAEGLRVSHADLKVLWAE